MVHELRHNLLEPAWHRVETEADYLAHLHPPPDVILADFTMPQLDARRALQILNERDLDVPFIIVSGTIGEDVAVEMMKQGAADYLLKDRLARLGPAVRRAIAERDLRRDKARAEQELRESEARLCAFLNNTPALVSIKDEEGRILYINNTCEQMWNTTLGRWEGKGNEEIWPADIASTVRSNDLEVLRSGVISRAVERMPSAGGNLHDLLSYRFAFTDGTGRRMLGCLGIDITEQRRAEKLLKEALESRDVLLKEVHHRVKNNLQIISTLLTMEAAMVGDATLAAALEACRQRVQSMTLIHERLHVEARDTDALDFREYAEALAAELIFSHGVNPKRVRLRLDLAPLTLPMDQALACGLIMNELLSNSLKHAFPRERAGEVVVSVQRSNDDTVTLRVADNGVGMPPNFDIQRSKSLGLRIADLLARQLGGRLERQTGPGMDFSVTFRSLLAAAKATSAPAAGRSAN